MKRALILVLFPLFLIGVFGDDVSVKEGESVTLHTGLTELQKTDGIEWKFNGTRIAKISSGILNFNSTDVTFRARLQLDSQTGDLKIRNIKTTDSGEYKLKITRTKSSEKIFSVNVVASADRDAVSVMVGDSVTLNTGLTKIQTDDVIRWRFGPQNSPIAEINIKTRNVSTHDGPDERFMGKLKPDYWTGSLTIRNIGTKHSGLYEVDISRSGHTIHKSFSVTVSDKDAVKTVSVTEGESVTLNTGLTEIQRDNEILWKFRDTHIAHIIKADEQFYTSDERFRDRLKLDHQTGSLTITNSKFTDSGHYEVTIRDSKYTVLKSIPVTVIDVKSVSVMEGGSVHLQTGVTEIQKDAQILWKFKDQVIPTDRLKDPKVATTWSNIDLNKQTGDLNITNIRTNQFGDYKVEIITGSVILHKKFLINMIDSGLSAGAWTCVYLLIVALVVALVVALAEAGAVICYRRRISVLKSQMSKLSTLKEEDSLTMKVTGKQTDD